MKRILAIFILGFVLGVKGLAQESPLENPGELYLEVANPPAAPETFTLNVSVRLVGMGFVGWNGQGYPYTYGDVDTNRAADALKVLQDARVKFPGETDISFELGAVLDRRAGADQQRRIEIGPLAADASHRGAIIPLEKPIACARCAIAASDQAVIESDLVPRPEPRIPCGLHAIRVREHELHEPERVGRAGLGGEASTWLVTSADLHPFHLLTIRDPSGAVLATAAVETQ